MLELQRNLVFGQFVNIPSPIHRADPRAKMVATFFLVAAGLVLTTLQGFAVLAPLILAIHVITRIPWSHFLRGSRYFAGFVLFFLVFNALFLPVGGSPGYVWAHWGPFVLASAQVHQSIVIAVRVLVLYDVTTLLLATTTLVDLTDGIQSLFSPLQALRVPVHELGMVFVISLKFVPIFTEEAERMVRARAARGVPVDQGNPLVRARRLGGLLAPILIHGFRRADSLTEALDSRSYRGGAGRTRLRVLRTRLGDLVATAIVLAWVLIAYLVNHRAGW